MKILIMPSWYPNTKQNAGSFFKEQALFLNAHGFDVKILMAEELHTKSFFFHYLKRLFTYKSNHISTDYLKQDPEAYSFPLIIQKGWSEQEQIKMTNKKYLKAFKELTLKGWLPDMIHVQGTFKAGFSAKHISDIFNIPYVVIEHSPFKLAAYSNYRKKQIKNVLLQAYKVAAVSKYQRNRLIEDGIVREITVVWNLLDEKMFKRNKKLEKSKFTITTITRPIMVKDVDTFFNGVSQFLNDVEDRSNVEIVIVGHAGLNDELANTYYFNKKATELGITENCTFLPFLSREEIKILLHKTQVFVSTSLDEPFGVAIREAMLCGVPVISTKSGGPEDTIHNETGVLVEKKDHHAIAKALLEIYMGALTFDSEFIRNYVISQSGRTNFLKAMTKFYSVNND